MFNLLTRPIDAALVVPQSTLGGTLKNRLVFGNSIITDLQKICSRDSDQPPISRHLYHLHYLQLLYMLLRLLLYAYLLAVQQTSPQVVHWFRSVDYLFTFCFDPTTGQAVYDSLICTTVSGILVFIGVIHYLVYYRPIASIVPYLDELFLENIQSIILLLHHSPSSRTFRCPLDLSFNFYTPLRTLKQLYRTLDCLFKGRIEWIGNTKSSGLLHSVSSSTSTANNKLRSTLALIVILTNLLIIKVVYTLDQLGVLFFLIFMFQYYYSSSSTSSLPLLLYQTVEVLLIVDASIYLMCRTAALIVAMNLATSTTGSWLFTQIYHQLLRSCGHCKKSKSTTCNHLLSYRLATYRRQHTAAIHFILTANSLLISPGLSLFILCLFPFHSYAIVYLTHQTLPVFQFSLLLALVVVFTLGPFLGTQPMLWINDTISLAASHLVGIVGQFNTQRDGFRSKWKAAVYYELLHRNEKQLAVTMGVFGVVTRKALLEFLFLYVAYILFFIGSFS